MDRGSAGAGYNLICLSGLSVHCAYQERVISAGYQQARVGAGKRYYPLQTPIDFFEVDCREISDVEAVDGWLKPDEWRVLNYHGIEWGFSPISVAEFDRQMTELAKHRNADALEVVTFQEGADRFRHSESFGLSIRVSF